MRDALPVLLFFVGMYVLQRWILPRFGVPT
jgi:hypothetical protein